MEDDSRESYQGGNQVIDGIPLPDRDSVTQTLIMMSADEASGGIQRGDPITAIFFPVGAVFSVLATMANGDGYEIDSIGRLGLVGGEAIFGAKIASRSVICQIGGAFAQMPIGAFDRLASTPSFRDAINGAMHVQWFRAQQTIACNVAHSVLQRCARWIAMTRDESGTAEFRFRAEYASMMLGVPQDVLAQPMAALQTLGAIRYADEVVVVTSERKLSQAACECYTAPRQYAKTLTASARKLLKMTSP